MPLEDDKQQQAVNAIKVAFANKFGELTKLSNFVRGADNRLSATKTHIDSLQELARQLSDKASAVGGVDNKYNQKTDAAGLGARAIEQLRAFGQLVTGKGPYIKGGAYTPANISDIPFADAFPAIDTNDIQVNDSNKQEFSRAAVYGLAGFKRTVDESVDMLSRGMHMVGEGQAKVAEGVEQKDVDLVKEGLELSGLGSSMCQKGLSYASWGIGEIRQGAMGAFASTGLEKCSKKLNEASLKWGNAVDEIKGLQTAINLGGTPTPSTEPWAPDGVGSNTFYAKLDSIAHKIAEAAKSTWEGLGMTGVFIGHVAKLAGTVSICTAFMLGAVAGFPVTTLMLTMDVDGKASELCEKFEKFIKDNIEQSARDIMASEFVSSVSGKLTTCAAAIKHAFAPVDALLDGLSTQGLETDQAIVTAFKAVGDAITHCGVLAVSIMKQGLTKDTLDMVLKSTEAVYSGIKDAVQKLVEQAKTDHGAASDEYLKHERVGEGVLKACEDAYNALKEAVTKAGNALKAAAALPGQAYDAIKQAAETRAQGKAEYQAQVQQIGEAYAMAMGGDVKAERTQQVNKAIDEATQIFTKLRDAGAISQEEMNQYVKSFAPQEPAKSAKDLVDSVVSGISSVASRLAHGVVTIGQAIGEQQVSQSVKDLLSAPAADCKAVDEAMSKAANDNNVTAETLIGATVKACSTEQAQQTKGAAGIDQNTLQEAQQTKGAAGIDQNTLQEAAAGLASAVNEAGQISSLNQAETQIAQGQQQQSGGWSR
ncbi:msp1B [Anaplasma ovis str. Haibei]|uniref:Msp1B n=1 Tax=Anaplasma ovis str. Haibei TaxID=1248439 RepID=A0A2Z2LE24_9RICK|nr:hypothetical protein [Anaplasma ovis]ASI47437.1 msp1B [Anaplasma ovis str. Haibei]